MALATGKWDLTIKAMGQTKEGELDFDAKQGNAMGMDLPMETIIEEGNKVKFKLLVHGGQEMKFIITMDGDTFEGVAKFGPMKLQALGKRK